MAVPLVSGSFGDLLDPRFRKIFFETYKQLPSMRGNLYTEISSDRDTVRDSSVGTLGDLVEFTGTITYDDMSQGYDVTETHKQFASGYQVERVLFDDDQFNIMDRRPAGLATSVARTQETHSARLFNNAFSIDTFFYNHSEAVALCSNSHTTTSGASTTTSQSVPIVGKARATRAVPPARGEVVAHAVPSAAVETAAVRTVPVRTRARNTTSPGGRRTRSRASGRRSRGPRQRRSTRRRAPGTGRPMASRPPRATP